jgi:hypothetical protein
MDEICRNSEGIVCDILISHVQDAGEIRSTAFALYRKLVPRCNAVNAMESKSF